MFVVSKTCQAYQRSSIEEIVKAQTAPWSTSSHEYDAMASDYSSMPL